MDEPWSYVGNKSQQCWLWYAWSPHFKRVFAYALGPRADITLKTLLDRVKEFNVRLFCTDQWGAYDRLLPEVRTRIKRLRRKTICFSRS
jgi:insertion element IS1 protein InsB